MRRRLSLLGCLLAIAACAEDPFPSSDELTQLETLQLDVPPVDLTNSLSGDATAAALGRDLFYDTSFSRNPDGSPCGFSCASCHKPDASYADTVALSKGCAGTPLARHTPSLVNSAYGTWYFWDGRKDSLWSQASGPLFNPNEMNTDEPTFRARMKSAYGERYAALFGGDPTSDELDLLKSNFGKAIEAYERTLLRVDSPFDRALAEYLPKARAAIAASGTSNGDELQAELEKLPQHLGLKLFVRRGRCVICHTGPALADDKFHNIGLNQWGAPSDTGNAKGYADLMSDPLNASGAYSDDQSLGVARITNLGNDPTRQPMGAFKTASLRNVALTPPYMHNGSLKGLRDVVEFYARGGDTAGTYPGTQTSTVAPGFDLTSDEEKALVALLESMTGDTPPP